MAFTDYSAGGNQTSGIGLADNAKEGYWSLARMKRGYLDYVGSKTQEIEEQKQSRRYRHGTQYTDKQIKDFNKRHQPVVTFNRIAPKINGVIGLIEKLRQAPKAYPRTPKEEESADLATAVVRYVLDEQAWKAKAPVCAENASVDGYGGIELVLEQGDRGDVEVGFETVDGDSFFYDPRSYKLDFTDCRYMGTGKWLDVEAAIDMFPDKEDELRNSLEVGTDLTTNSDREQKWFISQGDIKRVRIIDFWYKHHDKWCYCLFSGEAKLKEGESPFIDEKGKSDCKYIMFSASVDQDGDRYGFVRQFKSVQDEINQRRSKALHLLNTRRIIAEAGAFDDIEVTRLEAAKPDGVIIRNTGFEAEFDDASKMAEMEGQVKFLQEAKQELDSYGPTLSLIGEVGQNLSGRAISLQQQAGIAQLGPFILSYRSWKLRVYRALWNAIKQHWKAERWVRVTDDDNAPQLVGLNQVGMNPQTGLPQMVNQVSALDVDIIMDEGPDTINMMADTYDALLALVQAGAQVPPNIILELAPGIDSATRKRLIDQLTQPNPMDQQKQQIEIQGGMAKVQGMQADAALKKAQTMQTLSEIGADQGGAQEHPSVTAADVENTQADTVLKKAQALKTMGEAVMAPPDQAHQQEMDRISASQAEQKQNDERARQAQEQQQAAQDEQLATQSRRDEDLHTMKLQDHHMKIAEGHSKIAAQTHQIEMAGHEANKAKQAENKKAESDGKAQQALTQNSKAMADAVTAMQKSAEVLQGSADLMAKAVSTPKKISRDAKGRIAQVG